jgi:beta-mannosidase
MQTTSLLLHSGWELSRRDETDSLWLPATVPGHVHSDLVRAGVIGDPFFRLGELGARWVDEADWTYRTVFSAERVETGRQFLLFHGIDTVGRVFLNGQLLGSVENYFLAHRFDVTGVLKDGENELTVELDSALRVGRERAAAYLGDGTSERGRQTYFNFAPRAFLRKPQYMFGWDWGPELVSCGIPGNVELLSVPVAEILDWSFDYDLHSENLADIRISVTVEKFDDSPLLVGCAIYAPGDNTPDVEIVGPAGVYTANLEILDQEVTRWHPSGRGPQRRYLLNLRVRRPADKEILAHKGVSIGFRTITLSTEDGEMAFLVNGEKLFAKGANWIPDGCFPGEITKNRLRERLTQARDAGFNMLRVWGGGLYESEEFYDLCDSLGLLVWQDFPFACSSYPDDLAEFVESVEKEAIQNVQRLRHRACLCLWCGGNENLELFQGRWSGADQATKFFGEKLISETLPGVLERYDPRTPYLPNSPWGDEGEGNCQNENVGDAHYWNVWHAKEPTSNGDWTNYAKSRCRFSSEFGFAAPAGHAAWDSCLTQSDKTVRSLASQWHDKTRKGYETYLNFISMHFPEPKNWDELVYFGQANQAMALSFGIEHWRRQMGRCWGTLYWQLNDCWPTHSWSTIDSAGVPKLAYWAVKRSYADLLLSLVPPSSGAEGTVEAHLVSDLRESVSGTLTLQLLDFHGRELERVEKDVMATPNAASGALLTLATGTRPDAFVHATFGDAKVVLLLDEPKNLNLPDPQLSVTALDDTTLEFTAQNFAAFVTVDGALSDNGFHLLPGQTKRVSVAGDAAVRRWTHLNTAIK